MELTQVYKVVEGIEPADLGEELAMLNVDKGEYYVTNEIGKVIWGKLDGIRDVQAIVNLLLTEYEIDQESCINQTTDYLEELLNDGLISEVKINE